MKNRPSSGSNLPDGCYDADPNAPWNEPDLPEWLEDFNGTYRTYCMDKMLPDVSSPEEAISTLKIIIEELQEAIKEIEEYI